MTMLPAGTLSKVPEVTLGFWVIKVLATTLGGTTAVIPNKTNRRKPFPYNKRPVTATRSSACSVASKTHAASLPVTTNAPGTSSAPSA